MFMISISYIAPLSKVDQHIEAHVSYLDKQYAEGMFLASGKKVPRTGGIILATAQSREELDLIITQDPFYIEQVASFEVVEFIPTKAASGLAGLLEEQPA